MNMEEKKQVKSYLVGRFTWRIENFSNLNESVVYSNTFAINENRWWISLFPKGDEVEYLSVYLEIPDSASLPDGWSRTAKFSIALINQLDSNKSVKEEDEHQFTAEESDWGFDSLLPLSKLHDKNGCYLVNDTCLIEVEVSEPDALLVFSNKPLDSFVPRDSAESVCTQAQSFLKSAPKKSTSPVSNAICEIPLLKEHAISAKECFNKLVSFPLDDLVYPKHETAMIESLSVLSDKLSLFSHKQAEEIMDLKATLPDILRDCRDSVQVKFSTHCLLSTFEKTNNFARRFSKK